MKCCVDPQLRKANVQVIVLWGMAPMEDGRAICLRVQTNYDGHGR